MIPENLSFKALKTMVGIVQVLTARNAIAPMRREGNRLIGPCPIHHGDNPRAFVADLERGLWHCFTGCNAGGDVVDLVRSIDSTDYRGARKALAEIAGSPSSLVVPMLAEPRSVPSAFTPFIRRLSLDPDVTFLLRKGIRPQTALRFEAGRWHGPGFLADCIGVRLHDLTGHPLGYAGRRLDPDEIRRYGKWKLPSGLPKRETLYNAHRISRESSQAVVVVECPWGVMRLSQLKIPAVALLGTGLTLPQGKALASFNRVILLMDGDPAGRGAASRIASLLRPQLVDVVHLPEGQDPDDLVDDALSSILSPFLSS